MQISSNTEMLERVEFLTGCAELVGQVSGLPAAVPFSDEIVAFLNAVSKEILTDPEAKAYSDAVTFAFWIRRGSVLKLKERFTERNGNHRLGRGVVFHIAPSNVPANFAYSLAAGLMCGNANIVRVPGKAYAQVRILTEAFRRALSAYPAMKPYVLLVRYDRDREINDCFSSLADVRVIWGGDQTIAELRRSPLAPRAGEITFADRYSLAVLDSDSYLANEDKNRVAEDFYNDTYFSDQNACTSPRAVIWTGNRVEEAKALFWEKEHELVKKRYELQAIQSVNKLSKAYLFAAERPDVKIEAGSDNLIVRIAIPQIPADLMEYRENSGYFYEYTCEDIMELKDICNDKRCQTIAYLGDKNAVLPLIRAGVKGVDRVVPLGKTMDFDLIWDGYDLPAVMTRTIALS